MRPWGGLSQDHKESWDAAHRADQLHTAMMAGMLPNWTVMTVQMHVNDGIVMSNIGIHDMRSQSGDMNR